MQNAADAHSPPGTSPVTRPEVLAGLAPCLVIVALCLAAFWPTFLNDFTHLDDRFVVVLNPQIQDGVTPTLLRWAFSAARSVNWYPLTWVSHAFDIEFFGLRAGGHHLTSLLLHIANAIILFLVLARMTRDRTRSFLAAAVFAVHPLQVESVAWVSERSNVLSTFFWFLGLGAWLHYTRRPTSGRYLVVLGLFAAGLMSKPILVTFPLTLLLLDWWPLGRLGPVRGPEGLPVLLRRARTLCVEKVPLLLLSLAAGAITLFTQRSGGAVRSLDEYALVSRLANAFLSYLRYLRMLIWPADLSPYYPHPGDTLGWGTAVATALALVLVTGAALACFRRLPAVAVGWLWYLVVLLPVIGILQVGYQSHADRFAYVSHLGVSLALFWSVPAPARRSGGAVMVATVAAVLCVLVWSSNRQTRLWHDSESLAVTVLAREPENWLALNNLTGLRLDQNRLDEAASLMLRAMRLRPADPGFRYNLAVVMKQRGDIEAALHHVERAGRLAPGEPRVDRMRAELVEARDEILAAADAAEARVRSAPGSTQAYLDLSEALGALGRHGEAAGVLRAAAAAAPQDREVRLALETVSQRGAHPEEAEFRLRERAADRPADPEPLLALGSLLAKSGRLEEAAAAYREARDRAPAMPRVRNNLGAVLAQLGKADEAERELREALRLQPAYAEARSNLVRLLARAGRDAGPGGERDPSGSPRL